MFSKAFPDLFRLWQAYQKNGKFRESNNSFFAFQVKTFLEWKNKEKTGPPPPPPPPLYKTNCSLNR